MVRLLASLLLLGVFPHAQAWETQEKLPGIELISVRSPAVVAQVDPPALTASGAILVDLASGQVLFESHADTPRPMASLTKIMTALLILEHHDMDETVTVPDIAQAIGGSGIGLTSGQHFRLGDLFTGMLVPSANDAAYALAVYHSGSVQAFVKEMNARAASLGLKSTHFANPAGLDEDGQYSSARDLAWLSMAALRHEMFRTTVRTRTTTIRSKEGTEFSLRNTNEFLHNHDNVYGVKTGTTDKAGQCLITLFDADGRSYMFALLGSKDRYKDAGALMHAVTALLPSPPVAIETHPVP